VLSRLVDDLFELGQIEAGALAFELRELPIAPVVERAFAGIGAAAASRGIRLETQGPADATARFAPDKIERVLLNLLTNALRHTPTDGCVAVVVRAGGGEGAARAVGGSSSGRGTTRCTSGWTTPVKASTMRRSSGCSSASGAATWRAPHPARVSGSPSLGGSPRG